MISVKRIAVIFSSMMLLILVFTKPLEGLLLAGKNSFLDELAILGLVTVALIFQYKKNKVKKLFVIIALVGMYLMLVTLLFGIRGTFFISIAQAFLYLQYFLLLVSLYVIYMNCPKFITRVLLIAISISFVGVVFQASLPHVFASFFGETSFALGGDSHGDLRIEGFQLNPNALGIFMAFCVVSIMFCPSIIERKRLRVAFFLASILVILLSGSRSAFIYILIAFYFHPIASYKKWALSLLFVAGLTFSGGSDVFVDKTISNISQVEGSVNDTKYIRWLMTYYGTVIAIENFPIGLGSGAFGSAFSEGSPAYDKYGLSNLASVVEGRGIHDSNFGSIAGEFGVIGLIIFFGLNFYLIKYVLYRGLNFSLNRENILFMQAMMAITTIAPFMRPLFSSSYYGVIVVLIIFSYIEYVNQQRNLK